jgi:hypothetical protein
LIHREYWFSCFCGWNYTGGLGLFQRDGYGSME